MLRRAAPGPRRPRPQRPGAASTSQQGRVPAHEGGPAGVAAKDGDRAVWVSASLLWNDLCQPLIRASTPVASERRDPSAISPGVGRRDDERSEVPPPSSASSLSWRCSSSRAGQATPRPAGSGPGRSGIMTAWRSLVALSPTSWPEDPSCRAVVSVRSCRYSGPTTGWSTREPAQRRKSADELKWAEPGSAHCGEERTGLAGRVGQSARIFSGRRRRVWLGQPHAHTGSTERLRAVELSVSVRSTRYPAFRQSGKHRRTASRSGPGLSLRRTFDRCWPSTTPASGWPAPMSIPGSPNGYSCRW